MSEDGDTTPEEVDESAAETDVDAEAESGDGGNGDEHGPMAGLTDASALPDRAAEFDDELAETVQTVLDEREELTTRVEELESSLDTRETEVEDLQSTLKRTQADFQNYKKRRKREEEKLRERATEGLVERLLDVRDNLVRALSDDHEDVAAIREGVKMTLNEFDRVLDAENVREIDPVPGEEVDPARHEVMMRVDSDQPKGTIADVYQPGYGMADRVIRPAKITVSEGGEEGSEQSEQTARSVSDESDEQDDR